MTASRLHRASPPRRQFAYDLFVPLGEVVKINEE